MEGLTQISQVESQRATIFCKDEKIEKCQNERDFRELTTITSLSSYEWQHCRTDISCASPKYATFLFRAPIEVSDGGKDPETIPSPPRLSSEWIRQSTESGFRNELKRIGLHGQNVKMFLMIHSLTLHIEEGSNYTTQIPTQISPKSEN